MDKEFKTEALKQLEKAKDELSMAESRLDDIEDLIRINIAVEDFILDLTEDDRLPSDIKEKAAELFRQI